LAIENMTGLLTILEGAGKGASKRLTSSLMIVGRSKNADFQVEDPLVSRRHLEIRVEADAVFVENKSTHGSSLNGKPLVGVVSLNAGDVIQLGATKLRFDEAAPAPAPSGTGALAEATDSKIDGTRIADPGVVELHRRKEDASPDETRAVVEDGTRMLNPSELPNWVAQEREEKTASSKKGALASFLLLVILLAMGGGYWYFFMRGTDHSSADGMTEHNDALYTFNLEYPLDWSKITDDTGVIVFGFGGEGNKEWGRLKIYTDKDAQFEVTGLTDGFLQYQETLKKRYPGFELTDSEKAEVNNATLMVFWFNTPTEVGKGFYTLNADARIVVECVSPKTCYQQYSGTYSSILGSFHFDELETQQFIDFPQPDTGMQQLALASPSDLAKQVDEYAQRAGMLLATRDVKPDNLFSSMQEYRKALQLAIAGPQRLPAFRPLAKSLAEATRLFNQALEQQRFEIKSALKQGDRNRAYWAANKMMQMVPDKTDPAYQEASRILRSLPHPNE
jgi:pSer/pThr/pTyr-binding forkhead associated (FHA) protein